MHAPYLSQCVGRSRAARRPRCIGSHVGSHVFGHNTAAGRRWLSGTCAPALWREWPGWPHTTRFTAKFRAALKPGSQQTIPTLLAAGGSTLHSWLHAKVGAQPPESFSCWHVADRVRCKRTLQYPNFFRAVFFLAQPILPSTTTPAAVAGWREQRPGPCSSLRFVPTSILWQTQRDDWVCQLVRPHDIDVSGEHCHSC